MQKESRRNAEVKNEEKRINQEMDTDIPEMTRLKAHLKRRIERRTKNKWVQYATEFASEIVLASPTEKSEMRRYLEMTKEAVMDMDRKDKEKRSLTSLKKIRLQEKHTF